MHNDFASYLIAINNLEAQITDRDSTIWILKKLMKELLDDYNRNVSLKNKNEKLLKEIQGMIYERI